MFNLISEYKPVLFDEMDLAIKNGYCVFPLSPNPLVISNNDVNQEYTKISRSFVVGISPKVSCCKYGVVSGNKIVAEKFLIFLRLNGIIVYRPKSTNDFFVTFKFYYKGEPCYYAFCSGNNGQEFISSLAIPNIEFLKDLRYFGESVRKIDDFLYEALERFGLWIF